MADTARGKHVSPGIYTREYELSYAVKSLGITTLGAVGETLKGPAFQPMQISDWREFQDVFGGTSTEKFKGSQYPKYELPYIAKSYLSESNQMNVVRVLGLSGYNAGPAWLVTASKNEQNKVAVAVLRSRGSYQYHNSTVYSGTNCDCINRTYDLLTYQVGEINQTGDTCNKKEYNEKALVIGKYSDFASNGNSCTNYSLESQDGDFKVDMNNYGRFSIYGLKGPHAKGEAASSEENDFKYAVSLNPTDKDYILKVLGTNPYDGDAPIYVESLYDVALYQGIEEQQIDQLDSGLTFVQVYRTSDYCGLKPVSSLMNVPETALSRKHVGMRVLCSNDAVVKGYKCVKYDYNTNLPVLSENPDDKGMPALESVKAGQIYTVKQYTDVSGKRHYYYTYFENNVSSLSDDDDEKMLAYDNLAGSNDNRNGSNKLRATLVYNNADGMYYRHQKGEGGKNDDVTYVELDMNDYRSAYRYASTPWIVSNLKGDAKHGEVNKMFRFHTISDGDSSNYMVKVSIENILPDSGEFDVVVRDINDSDESILPLEKFAKCTMIPGDSHYIAYRIGSFDGLYESKSKYITVEVNETSAAQNSVPCGFLGYPRPKYDGVQIGSGRTNVSFPTIRYNLDFDEDKKNRKQYFGLSNITGVDVDLFTFKGTKAYINNPAFLSHGFHLDCRLKDLLQADDASKRKLYVDGVSGYAFDCVSSNARTQVLDNPAIISTEADMYGSIYQYTNLRKFTVYFYGGFDGWDVFRDERTTGDDYKMTQYRGFINKHSGEGDSFNMIAEPELLGLNQNGITSDWYAYLSGIRQFANPESVDINVFVTPGIDYVNNTLLVKEAIEMIEEERADSIYVITTPDKPKGASDFPSDMYTPLDAVYNLEDAEIDSNYSCTYYPWVKYLDQDNNQYIYLPPTKDVVRNFAATDNTSYPWFAPAGIDRGSVDCVRAKYITKLADEDELYEGRINPIKTFSSEGPKVWGQKNLQVHESQLNRIAVRRLILRMRKLISIACIGLIFEQYDSTIKQSFISAITPILDAIRSNRGISDYRIEVDDSIEARDARELRTKLFFKPYNALEYISIDLILTREGISFDDI